MADHRNFDSAAKEDISAELQQRKIEYNHEKIMALESFSKDKKLPTIYRVPDVFRKMNERAYTPSIVAIGPLHRGKKHLQAMEEEKLSYTNFLFYRTGNFHQTRDLCYSAMLEMASDAKRCYADDVRLNNVSFAEMMLVDGCFMIELFYRWNRRVFDPILVNAFKHPAILQDLILLENQIPFEVLEKLFPLTVERIPPENSGPSLTECVLSFYWDVTCPKQSDLDKKDDKTTFHVLHLVHSCHLPLATEGIGGVKSPLATGGATGEVCAPLAKEEERVPRAPRAVCAPVAEEEERVRGVCAPVVREEANVRGVCAPVAREEARLRGVRAPVAREEAGREILKGACQLPKKKQDYVECARQLPEKKQEYVVCARQLPEKKQEYMVCSSQLPEKKQDYVVCGRQLPEKKEEARVRVRAPVARAECARQLPEKKQEYVECAEKKKEYSEAKMVLRNFKYSATELDLGGIKFVQLNRPKEKKDIFHVEFLPHVGFWRRGQFKIPPFHVDDFTELFWRNFIAFEQSCHFITKSYFTAHAFLMDRLINTSEDVQLLEKRGIIVNSMGSPEEVAYLFNNLCNNIDIKEFNSTKECRKVIDFHKRLWPKFLVKLRRDYFSNPWTAISVLAAIGLFVLTLLQTIYTMRS